jgi:hypothetical protein
MNNLMQKKLMTVLALVMSWSALLWINFSAELTMAMHFIAIPFLLVVTGGYAAYYLEQSIDEKDGVGA